MYDKASNGGRPNNNKYSPCSIRAIIKKLQKKSLIERPLIKERNTDADLRCFEVPKKIIERRPTCGDTVRQHYEQCDCGTPEECKISDPGNCCNQKTCQLRPGAYCSASDGRFWIWWFLNSSCENHAHGMSEIKPRTVEKISSTLDPLAAIEPAPLRCRCKVLNPCDNACE